jgi:predicted enzyme related to lactoylglutathione lyase
MNAETTAADIMAFSPRPALLPRLSLVVIRAADPAQLVPFYSALGMSFAAEQHGTGPLHYVSTDIGITFEIYPRSAAEAPTTGTRLGFTTVALDVVLKALAASGGQIVTPARVTSWGRRAVVIDPEGHKVEVTELESV